MDVRRAVAGCFGVWAFAWASPAAAAPVIVTFSGTVLEADDSDGITDGSVHVGTAVSGTLTFDRAAPATSLDANFGVFDLTTPPAALHIDAGSYSLSASAGIQITTADFGPADAPYNDVFQALTVLPNPAGVAGANPQAGFGLVLADAARTALGSPALTGVPFVLGAWSTPDIAFRLLSDTGEFNTVIQVQSLAPEPGLFALAGVGILSLVGARARTGVGSRA
jgi:hypothetical protein